MPKMKTHRGAAKRFRKTASGKYKAGHANRSHILTKMATKRKRNLRQTHHIDASDAGRLDRMPPHFWGALHRGKQQAREYQSPRRLAGTAPISSKAHSTHR